MLPRKICRELPECKNRKHKCLLVSRQRQVGKTFIVREFGAREYENVAEVDSAADPSARNAFAEGGSADRTLLHLSVLYPEMKIEPGKTLLYLDDVCRGQFQDSLAYSEENGMTRNEPCGSAPTADPGTFCTMGADDHRDPHPGPPARTRPATDTWTARDGVNGDVFNYPDVLIVYIS